MEWSKLPAKLNNQQQVQLAQVTLSKKDWTRIQMLIAASLNKGKTSLQLLSWRHTSTFIAPVKDFYSNVYELHL